MSSIESLWAENKHNGNPEMRVSPFAEIRDSAILPSQSRLPSIATTVEDLIARGVRGREVTQLTKWDKPAVDK
jgi:hypothetical protein